jgi:acetoacetate decarboxylase
MNSDGFKRQPGKRYDMPITFGPTELPDVSRWGWLRGVDISFITAHDHARRLVPACLDVPREPVVLFSRRSFDGVDYLGERGYEELCVGIGVSHHDGEHKRRGYYWLVLWVDDMRAAAVGREIAGWPKIGAEFPPVAEREGQWSFSMAEYGTTLMTGSITNAKPVDDVIFKKIADGASQGSYGFCWRHVPAIPGGRGIDQVTRFHSSGEITKAFVGDGELSVKTPTPQQAPHSARIMGTLAQLPIVRMLPGYIAEGSVNLDRRTITALTGGSLTPAGAVTDS